MYTNQTNEELVARIKAGIDVADNMLQLWQQNYGFIHTMALRYQGLADIEDLEQEGYLALYDAVDGFKPEYGFKFLAYAGRWMKQRMIRYIQNNGTVRIPVHEWQKIREYRKLVNDYIVHIGRKPTRREVARNLGISVKKVADLEETVKIERMGSLDSFLTDDEDAGTVLDKIASDVDVEEDVLTDVQKEQLKTIIWPLVDALPDKQGKVLRKRYQEGKTLKETGHDIGITIEGARQIEKNALRSLRYSRNARVLRSFLDDERIYSMGLSGTGLESFNRTWTSSTERAVFSLCGETK